MSFQSGSVSFRRFRVVGNKPSRPNPLLIEQLAGHAFKATEMGIPEEIEYGWSGGRNVLDAEFSFDNNVYAECLFFGLRIDTNKVPGDLKRAYAEMEAKAIAAGNPSGFISKAQKLHVKETVRRKCEDEMRGGRFRRGKVIPLLWDMTTSTLYAAISGRPLEMLTEIFERTFGFGLVPLSAGTLALEHLKNRLPGYENLRPTRFVHGPEGEGQYPEYPWVSKGPEPKDFLGNEFFTFLLAASLLGFEQLPLVAGDKPIDLAVDRQLDLDCAYGMTGSDSIRGDDPARTTGAKAGLKIGKVPRKMGVLMSAGKLGFSLMWSAESFAVASAKFPEVEDAETPRVLFEERITLLRELCSAIDSAYQKFLDVRVTDLWPGTIKAIRGWINK